MGDLVLRSDAGGVATLTLNRPDALNALSPALFVELRAHIDALTAEPDAAGVVVLRGAGRSFSAGNDLKAIGTGERAPSRHFQAETLDALEAMPQPVVAAVHGHCYTGALELALACDVILAAGSAKFADTHGKWGMSPTWGMTQRLPRRVGIQRAKDIMFTGRTVSGAEAEANGLALRCVADAEFDSAVDELTAAMAASSWWTLRTEKALLRDGQDRGLREGLDYERANSPGVGPDMTERLAGFGKRS